MYCYTVPQGPWCCHSRILRGTAYTTLDLTWPWPLYSLCLITLRTVCTVIQYHRGHGVVTVESRGACLTWPLTFLILVCSRGTPNGFMAPSRRTVVTWSVNNYKYVIIIQSSLINIQPLLRGHLSIKAIFWIEILYFIFAYKINLYIKATFFKYKTFEYNLNLSIFKINELQKIYFFV